MHVTRIFVAQREIPVGEREERELKVKAKVKEEKTQSEE